MNGRKAHMPEQNWSSLLLQQSLSSKDMFFEITEREGLSTTDIARRLSKSTSQIAHWKDGTEPIPARSLRDLHAFLNLSEDEMKRWTLITDCEDRIRSIVNNIIRGNRQYRFSYNDINEIVLPICTLIHKRKRHMNYSDEIEYFRQLTFSSEKVIKLLIDISVRDHIPLYSYDTLDWLLKHPTNLVFIDLINAMNAREAFRPIAENAKSHLLDAIATIRTSNVTPRARENAWHLISRLELDQQFVTGIGVVERRSDPMEKRALLFTRYEAEFLDACEKALRNLSDPVGEAIINFEIIHMDEAHTDKNGNFKNIRKPPIATIKATMNVMIAGTDPRRDRIRKLEIYRILIKYERNPLVFADQNSRLLLKFLLNYLMTPEYMEAIDLDLIDLIRPMLNQ